MVDDTKKGLLRKVQAFMGSYRGKVILNYAYSWGAAVVILGALFKLTHLPGANMMLWVGMGTEVLVFFISAFDLPVRPGAHTEQPDINIQVANRAETNHATKNKPETLVTAPVGQVAYSVPPAAVSAIPPAASAEMEEVTAAYLQQLKEMTATLARFTAQTESLSQDAEQISTLNRNLSGINAIYEVQLRSVSTQIGTIEQVHEQTQKMARQIEELNAVYARMLDAMNGNSK